MKSVFLRLSSCLFGSIEICPAIDGRTVQRRSLSPKLAARTCAHLDVFRASNFALGEHANLHETPVKQGRFADRHDALLDCTMDANLHGLPHALGRTRAALNRALTFGSEAAA